MAVADIAGIAIVSSMAIARRCGANQRSLGGVGIGLRSTRWSTGPVPGWNSGTLTNVYTSFEILEE